MNSLWIKAGAVVAAIWLVAAGVIWWARAAKPTPEAIIRYVSEHPLEGKGAAERGKTIETVAEKLNRLGYEERRQMRMGRKLDEFFRGLTPDEQTRFLDLTLPAGFKQMMEALNKMEPAKRKSFVDRALREMKEDEGQEQRPVDDKNVEKIVSQGLRSFYSDASAEVKMDVAPLIEQMQMNLQGIR